MLSWETGVQFGQALADIKANSRAIETLKSDVAEIKQDVSHVRAMIVRGALLVALASAGIMTNVSAETAGEAAASFIKAMRK